MAGEGILNIKYKGVFIYVEFRDIYIKLFRKLPVQNNIPRIDSDHNFYTYLKVDCDVALFAHVLKYRKLSKLK